MGESQYCFGPFRLDLAKRALTDAGRRVELSGRALDLLALLIRERHRAVSREELMAELWPDVIVEDGNLTVNISLIRKALHGGRTYIETLPRRGYRFCGELSLPSVALGVAPASETRQQESAPSIGMRRTCLLVGRAGERERMRVLWSCALDRRRQTLFVAGEPGAGKSALNRAFVADALASGTATIAVLQGHCLEHRSDSEPYLPLLEGLGRLCTSPDVGPRVLQLLERVAPTWLLQLNRGIEPAQRSELERRVAGLSARRMTREFADWVEAFSADGALLIGLDDLHWADPSTLDLVAHLARQTEPARCMVVASYRPAEAGAARALSALAAGLRLQGLASVIELGGLTPSAIGDYIASRLEDPGLGQRLAPVVHERTRGNPLFMVQVVDAFVESLPSDVESRCSALSGVAAVARLGAVLPVTTAARVELEVGRLELFERQILDAGSVVGGPFTAMVVASALDADVVQIERVCQAWARDKRLLRATGEETWPDGSRSTCYDLIHALYRDVIYRGLGAATRARLHQRIAERLERGFDGQPRRVAPELGHHFAGSSSWRRTRWAPPRWPLAPFRRATAAMSSCSTRRTSSPSDHRPRRPRAGKRATSR